MRHGSPLSARIVFSAALALACVSGTSRADSELLADTAFTTLGAAGSPWAVSDGATSSAQDGVVTIAGVSGFTLVWQDVRGDVLPPGSVLTCQGTAELVNMDEGRGAWLSVQFYDKFERRIGSSASGTLSQPGAKAELQVNTMVPSGVARASYVLALYGKGQARFGAPSASASELPPAQQPSAVTVRSGSRLGEWRGLGLSVDALSSPQTDLGSLSPALWRVLLPWGAPGEAPATEALDSLLPRLLAERNDCALNLVLTGGARANLADELRCAASLRALCEHVSSLAEVRFWVSPLDGPDMSGLVTLAEYERCIDAVVERLPHGVAIAGPEEWSGALWTAALSKEVLRRGGLVTCVVEVPRRDMRLAADIITGRVAAGAHAGVLRVFSDHPDEGTYGTSEDHALDLAALLVRACNAGLSMPLLDLAAGLPMTWVQELVRAFPPGGWVHGASVEPPGALDVLWATDGRGETRSVAVVNRGLHALPLEINEPQWERQTRVRRTLLLASPRAPREPEVLMARGGRLVDICAGRSVSVYSLP